MATTPFQDFVNLELPKRISTNVDPLGVQEGLIPVTTGVGLTTTLVDIDTILEQSSMGSTNVTLFTAKRLPVRSDGTAVLPNKPLGDFVYNTAIVHLTNDIIVEFIDITQITEGSDAVLVLPTEDFTKYQSEIQSVTVSYLVSA